MRKPNRTAEEKIEDAFADLSLDGQTAMLDRLASLHRWCRRERDRSPRIEGDAYAAGRAEYERVTGPQVLMMEKAVDLRSILGDALAVTKETKQ